MPRGVHPTRNAQRLTLRYSLSLQHAGLQYALQVLDIFPRKGFSPARRVSRFLLRNPSDSKQYLYHLSLKPSVRSTSPQDWVPTAESGGRLGNWVPTRLTRTRYRARTGVSFSSVCGRPLDHRMHLPKGEGPRFLRHTAAPLIPDILRSFPPDGPFASVRIARD